MSGFDRTGRIGTDATAARTCDHAAMDKPNRAERRKNKFGGGRATEHGGWPTVQPNPVFEADATDTEGESNGSKPVEPPKPVAKAVSQAAEKSARSKAASVKDDGSG